MTTVDVAYERLTDDQKRHIDIMLKQGDHTISGIACKLGLTRSFVQSYVQSVNSNN